MGFFFYYTYMKNYAHSLFLDPRQKNEGKPNHKLSDMSVNVKCTNVKITQQNRNIYLKHRWSKTKIESYPKFLVLITQ